MPVLSTFKTLLFVCLIYVFTYMLYVKRNARGFLTHGTDTDNNKNAKPKCCITCPSDSPKYYSIDTAHGFCGETCLADWLYPVYKIFEPGLHKAGQDQTVDTCKGLGYPNYSDTVTHGVPPITATLDLYAPKNNASGTTMLEDQKKAPEKVEQDGEEFEDAQGSVEGDFDAGLRLRQKQQDPKNNFLF